MVWESGLRKAERNLDYRPKDIQVIRLVDGKAHMSMDRELFKIGNPSTLISHISVYMVRQTVSVLLLLLSRNLAPIAFKSLGCHISTYHELTGYFTHRPAPAIRYFNCGVSLLTSHSFFFGVWLLMSSETTLRRFKLSSFLSLLGCKI